MEAPELRHPRLSPGRAAGMVDHEDRVRDRLRDRELVAEAPVRAAERLPVVRQQDDDGVLGEPVPVERVADPPDEVVGVVDGGVVHPSERVVVDVVHREHVLLSMGDRGVGADAVFLLIALGGVVRLVRLHQVRVEEERLRLLSRAAVEEVLDRLDRLRGLTGVVHVEQPEDAVELAADQAARPGSQRVERPRTEPREPDAQGVVRRPEEVLHRVEVVGHPLVGGDPDVRRDRRGVVARLTEPGDKRLAVGREVAPRVGGAVLPRVLAGEHRGVRRERPRGLRDRVLEHHGVVRQVADVGRELHVAVVRRDPVLAQRVEDQEHHVLLLGTGVVHGSIPGARPVRYSGPGAARRPLLPRRRPRRCRGRFIRAARTGHV